MRDTGKSKGSRMRASNQAVGIQKKSAKKEQENSPPHTHKKEENVEKKENRLAKEAA